MFDVEKPADFHAAVARVLSDAAYGRALGQAGHEIAARDYDAGLLARRIFNLYEDLIREKASS